MADDLYPVTRIGTSDNSVSATKCHECGEMVTFFTENGQLVAVNVSDRNTHRHQPPQNSPAANRARVEAMRQRK